MKKWLISIVTLLLVISTVTAATAKNDNKGKSKKFKLGVEVLLEDQIDESK